jgi:hypothetical protein
MFPALLLTVGAAVAQDFTAGKTPAQLFTSDCSTCHHLPNGLGKKYDNTSLAGFLREHYTTKPDTAGALAKYVMGFANLRATAITAPSAEEAAGARPAEDPKARRRATSSLSGDGEKPMRPRPLGNPVTSAPANARGNAELPKPPATTIAQPPSIEAAVQPPAATRAPGPAPGRGAEGEASPAKLNDYAHSGAPVVSREAADPIARIRAYAASGAGPQEAAAEAPKPASGKSRRRSDSGAHPAADAPPAVAAPAAPAPAPGAPPSSGAPQAGDKPGAPASVSSR